MTGAVSADTVWTWGPQALTYWLQLNSEQVDELSGVSTGVAVIVRARRRCIILDHGANYVRNR